METVLNISLIITSVMLIVLVVLQSRGAGLGGLTGGGETGSIFTARRGIEKVMFYLTIIFSALFFILAVTSVLVN